MSSSVVDPLLLLRTSLSSNATITLLAAAPGEDGAAPDAAQGEEVYKLEECSHIAFPVSSASAPRPVFPKETKTRYLAQVGGDAFTLQALLFAYIQRDETAPNYMKNARAAGLQFVSVIERKGVVEWLAGRSDIEGPAGRIVPLESSAKRPADTEDASTAGGEAAPEALAGAPAPKKQRYATNKEDHAKVRTLLQLMEGPAYAIGTGTEVKVEKTGGVFKNRETVLRGDRVNSFESARQLVGPRLKLAGDDLRRTLGAAATSSSQPGKSTKKKQQNPIIIISPSSTALITMHNVKKFLEESIFIHSDDARVDPVGGGVKASRAAEDVIIIEHARTTSSISSSLGQGGSNDGRKQRFYVVDGVEALSKFGGLEDAWDRVVCVMTTGQEWQFRPYKWTEPKELFHHVKGVFVQWTSDAPNTKVRSWNVTELRIDPTKRHIDKSTVADFWRNLEAWMAMNKPSLLQ
ncbi:hypothetical protein RQP46_000584 [Phenoliferia psychrophenolica]